MQQTKTRPVIGTMWRGWSGLPKKRGALLGGGRVNYQKAAEKVLTDFREGAIGCITLERHANGEEWLKVARRREAELKATREAKKLAQKNQSSN